MRVGFLVFDELEELDLLGPWEVFGVWASFDDGPAERLLVGPTTVPVSCAKGLRLTPDITMEKVGDLDLLLVPGGRGTRRIAREKQVLDFVAAQARHADVLSVCTGALVLASAGILAGCRATTHFASMDRLRAFDDIDVETARFTRNPGVWTSAGISAGIDMSLAYIAAHAGADRAGEIQRWAEYYPDSTRYGNAGIHADGPKYLKNA